MPNLPVKYGVGEDIDVHDHADGGQNVEPEEEREEITVDGDATKDSFD